MGKKNLSTNMIAEVGMISSINVIVTLMVIYLGLGPFIAISIIPIPITIIYLRQNGKAGFISILVNTCLVSLLSNPIDGFGNALIFGFIGLVVGFCLKKDKNINKTLCISGLLISIAVFIYFTMYLYIATNTGIESVVKEMVKEINMINNSLGNNDNIINEKTILKMIPAGVLITGYIFACLNFKLTTSVLKRLKYKINDSLSFSKFYIPNIIISITMIIFLFGVVLSEKNIVIGDYISYSSKIILVTIFLFQGISVISYYFRKKYNISKFLLMVIIILALLLHINIFFIIIGLVDVFINFRKIEINLDNK